MDEVNTAIRRKTCRKPPNWFEALIGLNGFFFSVIISQTLLSNPFSREIPFDPSVPFREEKEHIADYLHREMLELSEK